MSAPLALRLAIESCRPMRTTALRSRPLLQTRPFSYDRRLQRSHASDDITEGFPTPKSEPDPFEDEPTPEILSADTPAAAIPGRDNDPTAPTMPGIDPNSEDIEAMLAGEAPPATAAPPTLPATTPEFITSSESPIIEPEQPPKGPQLYPPNVLATYLAPMRHQPIHGIPVGSLQLRSFSLRNLEFFADWCMRAAFYLKMPARGPVPLPREVERWTTLKGNFVHKKSQENFERITYKRLITVMDAERSAVETWLAFVRKWQFYGVGMKANVWSYESVDVAKEMDKQYEGEIRGELNDKLSMFGWNEEMGKLSSIERLLKHSDKTRNVVGAPFVNIRERSESGLMREKKFGVVDVDEKEPQRPVAKA